MRFHRPNPDNETRRVENPWLLIYTSVVVTGLAYVAYFMAIKLSDATTGAIAFYIKPIIAPFLAILILKEMIMWNTVVGILLLSLASMITLISAKKKLN